jgi:hypothetical protein
MKKNIKNKLIRKDMDVSEYERLSNITLRHKFIIHVLKHVKRCLVIEFISRRKEYH